MALRSLGAAAISIAMASLVLASSCVASGSEGDPPSPDEPASGPGGIAVPDARFAEEIVYAAPPERIVAIDEPRFHGVGRATLHPAEPVLSLEIAGEVRAYPLRILLFHEIVNDVVGGVPVVVTYCPLCNTGIVFERPVVGGEGPLTFGVSGLLLHANLIMVDRQTRSIWSQALGEAIGGELEGTRLEFLPAAIVAWEDWSGAHTEGRVLREPSGTFLGPKTGDRIPYGATPYVGYDRGGAPLLTGTGTDDRLPGMARILAMTSGDDAVAVPFARLREVAVGGWGAVQVRLAGEPVVVLWREGTVSPLDEPLLSDSRDVGSAGAFVPMAGGLRLTFDVGRDGVVDLQTGSRWDVLGRAVSGPLEGTRLERVSAFDSFWFDWAAFHPQTRIAPAG